MGKWGLFLTFLLSIGILTAAWYFFQPDEPGTPELFETGPDAPFDGVPLSEVPEGPTRAVTGLVLDRATGQPVKGASVEFGKRRATTDGHGGWNLLLPTTRYHRRTDHDGMVRAKGYVPRSVTVSFDALSSRVRVPVVRLTKAAVLVFGRVFDHEGRPVPGANVGDVTTDDQGRFGPIPAALGRFWLTATAPNRALGTVGFVIRPTDPPEREVVINLPETVWVYGEVRDAALGIPLEGVEVRRNQQGDVIARTDAKGYEIPLVHGERVLLWFRTHGYLPASRDVVAGGSGDIVLQEGVRVEGRVLLSDGTPVGAGFEVLDRTPGFSTWRPPAVTDWEGRFRLTAFRADEVVLYVMRQSFPCGTFKFPTAPDMPLTGIELELAAPTEVTVVVRERGTELALEEAEILGGWPDPLAVTVTDEDGRATVSVMPTSVTTTWFNLLVRHEGHLDKAANITQVPGQDAYVKLWPKSELSILVVDPSDRLVPGAAVSVRVKSELVARGTTDGQGRVTLAVPRADGLDAEATHSEFGAAHAKTQAPGIVRLALPKSPTPPSVLVVRDAAGNPISSAMVEVHDGRGEVRSTDEKGRVEVKGDATEIRISAPGYQSVMVDEVTGEPVEVTLRPGMDLTVEVTDVSGLPIPRAGVEAWADQEEVAAGTVYSDTRGIAVLHGVPAGRALRLVVWGGGTWAGRQIFTAAGERQAAVQLPRYGRIRVKLGRDRKGEIFECVLRALDRSFTDMEFRRSYKKQVHDQAGELVFISPEGPAALWFRCGEGAWQVWPRLVVPASAPVDVTYTDPPPGQLQLRVLDAENNAIDAARIFACGVGQHVAWTTPAGRLAEDKAKDIPNGLVRFFIRHDDHATVITEPLDLSVGVELVVNMPAGGRVEGVLVDLARRPVRGWVRFHIHSGHYGEYAQTAGDGTFVIRTPLAEGIHKVEVTSPGRVPVMREIKVTEGVTNQVELCAE